jgi:hypothetical protein
VEALAAEIDALLAEPAYLQELGARARDTVVRAFTWEICGRATVKAYRPDGSVAGSGTLTVPANARSFGSSTSNSDRATEYSSCCVLVAGSSWPRVAPATD